MDTSATEYSVVQVIHLPLDLPLGCLWLSGQSAELSAQVCVHFSLDSIAQHTQSFLGFGQSGITGLPPTLYSCMLLQNIRVSWERIYHIVALERRLEGWTLVFVLLGSSMIKEVPA